MNFDLLLFIDAITQFFQSIPDRLSRLQADEELGFGNAHLSDYLFSFVLVAILCFILWKKETSRFAPLYCCLLLAAFVWSLFFR